MSPPAPQPVTGGGPTVMVVTDRPMPAHDAVGAPDRPLDGFHAIVPAGGAGTRLWPLSRQGRPKFLLDLTGSGRTLIQATVDRLAPLVGCLLYTSPSPRDGLLSRMPSSA